MAKNRKLRAGCMQDFIQKKQASHTKNKGAGTPLKILRGRWVWH